MNLTESRWNAEWAEQSPPFEHPFRVGDRVWYKGWIVGMDVPGGAKSYYKPVRVVRRVGSRFYHIEYPDRKRRWVRRRSLFPITTAVED